MFPHGYLWLFDKVTNQHANIRKLSQKHKADARVGPGLATPLISGTILIFAIFNGIVMPFPYSWSGRTIFGAIPGPAGMLGRVFYCVGKQLIIDERLVIRYKRVYFCFEKSRQGDHPLLP